MDSPLALVDPGLVLLKACHESAGSCLIVLAARVHYREHEVPIPDVARDGALVADVTGEVSRRAESSRKRALREQVDLRAARRSGTAAVTALEGLDKLHRKGGC